MVEVIKVYLPTDAQESYFKKMLKFTLKQLLYVLVQSHHHQGAHYFSFIKLQLLK